MRSLQKSRLSPFLLLLVLLVSADWPQFRGPNRDGRSTETGLAKQWPPEGPRVVWRVPLGKGYSGMAVASGRIFTMFGAGGDEFAVALDVQTGKELWRSRVDALYKDQVGDGPRATPTVSGELVYVVSGKGKLHALKAASGERVFMRDFVAEFGSDPPTWGFSSSPLVEGDLLLADVGGSSGRSLVAFDKKTGKDVWRSQRDKTAYSAPIAVTVGDKRQVVFFTAQNVLAVSPKDGTLLWKTPWKTSWDVNAATPIFIAPDKLFISSGYDVGAALFRITAEGATEVWRNREMKNRFSSSVLHDGYLYGFDEKTFKCVVAATGETKWRERGLDHGSLVYADGQLYVLGEQGILVLVEASPAEYRERARFQAFTGRTWTPPTLASGRLYVRDEHELVALNVAG